MFKGDLASKILKEQVGQATKIIQWPDNFVNSDSGTVYQPHNAEEEYYVYSDEPKYALIKGGEGCVAPETIIEGVPVAEWAGGMVSTLYGRENATRSYLKGTADLYEVKAGGKSVIVTLDHKFLTLNGWLPLRNFTVGVGQPIAVEADDRVNLPSPRSIDQLYRSYHPFDPNLPVKQTWAEIDDITFVRHGSYYDLTVPNAEHYVANGIYHHNSGKSVALIIKTLNRLRRGMSGAMLSPNLPSFKRSLFPELLRWLPRSVVIDSHQRYFYPGWLPRESFNIVVHNEIGGYSTLLCASAESPRLLEGPNLNFVAMDEIRGMVDPEILKVMSGRIRIVGPRGEPSQLYCSSTPAMSWMFDYFGPVTDKDTAEMKTFKDMSYVATVSTAENEAAGNVESGYVEARGATLTEEEKLVRLSGEWVNEENPMRFVPDIITWDILKDDTLQLPRKRQTPNRNWSDTLTLAIDASVSRDYTALIGVSRHPKNRKEVAVRLVKIWKPTKGGMIDFQAVEDYITEICKTYHVAVLAYDSFQMEQMAQNLFRDGVVWTKKFSQQAPRTLADQFLFDCIILGKIYHMGQVELREHLDNANVKIDLDQHKKRIIKRSKGLKIDAAVALSMANYECLRLNI